MQEQRSLESVIEAVTRHREIGGFVRDDRRRFLSQATISLTGGTRSGAKAPDAVMWTC